MTYGNASSSSFYFTLSLVYIHIWVIINKYIRNLGKAVPLLTHIPLSSYRFHQRVGTFNKCKSIPQTLKEND